MAGALRKTMLYLGLADDRSEHEEYLEEFDDQEVAVPQEYEAQVTPLHRPTRTTLPTQAAPPTTRFARPFAMRKPEPWRPSRRRLSANWPLRGPACPGKATLSCSPI